MLGSKQTWLACVLFALACGEETLDPGGGSLQREDAETPAPKHDAKVAAPDAAPPNEEADAAVSEDASSEVDASEQADVGAAGPGWQEVAEGPAPASREVCAWRHSLLPRLRGTMPVELKQVRVDAEGNAVVVGSITETRDLGAGPVVVPWLDERRGTLVLKFDAQCKLLWSKLLAPQGERNVRDMTTFGFVGDDVVVLTFSSSVSTAYRFDVFEASTMDFALLASRDGSVRSEHSLSTGDNPLWAQAAVVDGVVAIYAYAYEGLDLGNGPIADPAKGPRFNAFFTPAGELLRSEVFGGSTPTEVSLQLAFGPNQEQALVGANVPDYFGQVITAQPSVLKLDAERKLMWRHELSPLDPQGALDEGSFYFAASAQGSLLLTEAWNLRDVAVRRYTPDGKLAFQLPITSDDTVIAPSPLRLTERASAMISSVQSRTRYGKLEVDGPEGEDVTRSYAVQLDARGVVLWAHDFANDNPVIDLDVASDEAAFVLAQRTPELQLLKLAR